MPTETHIVLDLVQPATILTMMDVHSDVRCGVAEETELVLAPAVPTERFVDDNGNIVRRLSAPTGIVSLRLQGAFHSDGCEDEVDTDAADIPMITTFGPHRLTRFAVVKEEIEERASAGA